jgi:hypothetical protein
MELHGLARLFARRVIVCAFLFQACALGVAAFARADENAAACVVQSWRHTGHERAFTRSNPFFSEAAARIPTVDLQWYALDALGRADGVPDELKGIVAHKIHFFHEPSTDSVWLHSWRSLPLDERAQGGAEYSLTTFVERNNDSIFRRALFDFLKSSKLSGPETTRRLIPFAAGASYVSPRDLNRAEEAIRGIADRMGSHPARFTADSPRTDARDILRHEPIESIKSHGGGINLTLTVKFVNGQKAIFKPREGEVEYRHHNPNFVEFTRELTTEDIVEDFLGNRVAREAGVSPLTVNPAEAVVLVHDGKNYGLGSLQTFADGYFDIEKIALDHRYGAVWSFLRHQPKWKKIEKRIRTIDYIQGNFDRLPLAINDRDYPKNFMIRINDVDFSNPEEAARQLQSADMNTLSISLIDNGLGRNSLPQFSIDTPGHFPLRADIPDDLKDAILNFDEERFRLRMLGMLPEFGIQDFINRIHAAQRRIQHGP